MHQGYFAIIPAGVRYDKSLPPNAKLLYGEITALCNERGYCWATNSYFADLYDVKDRSITNWLGALEEAGYICRKQIFENGTKRVQERRIYLSEENTFSTPRKNLPDPLENNFPTPPKKSSRIIEQVNNTSNNIGRFTPPTINMVTDYIREKGYVVDAEKWMSHYQSNGWKVGKNKMVNWKAAVTTWSKSTYAKTAQVDSIKKRNVIESLTDRSWAYDKG